MHTTSLSTPLALRRPSSTLAPLCALLALVLGWVFPQASLAQPQRVRVEVSASAAAVRPGGQVVLAVLFDHDDGWHTQPNIPTIPDLIPTSIELAPTPGLTVGPIQWPKPGSIQADFDGTGVKPVAVYEGRARAFVPLQLALGAPPGPRQLDVSITYQVCDDSICLAPRTEQHTIALSVDADAATPPLPAAFSAFDATVFARLAAGQTSAGSGPSPTSSKKVSFNVFGWKFSIDASGFGFGVLLLLAVLGGLVLNITPCVLPVIPLKIMGLQQAAGSKGRTLALGIVMCAGVVAFWLALGGLIAGSTTFRGAGQLFAVWWFTLGIGVFILVMGLGSMGLFNVGLPQWVYTINPRHDTIPGAFLFGIMTAILATPCVGPFMGSAVGWAVTQSAFVTLLTFGAVGVGMALPYFVLAAKPQWVKRVPKAGPVGDLVKQVLGLLMIAVSMFFIGSGLVVLAKGRPFLAPVLHWWAVAALCAVAMGWMLIRGFAVTKRPGWRAAIALLAVSLVGTSFWWANSQTLAARSNVAWQDFTPERYQSAKASGKAVLVDFTAVWCLNCKALDSIMHSDKVIAEIDRLGVIALTADVTAAERSPGWKKLVDEEQRLGPPWAIIEGPGLPGGWRSEAYTTDEVIRTLRTAARAQP